MQFSFLIFLDLNFSWFFFSKAKNNACYLTQSQNETFYLIFYHQKEKKIEKLCIDKIENLKTTN